CGADRFAAIVEAILPLALPYLQGDMIDLEVPAQVAGEGRGDILFGFFAGGNLHMGAQVEVPAVHGPHMQVVDPADLLVGEHGSAHGLGCDAFGSSLHQDMAASPHYPDSGDGDDGGDGHAQDGVGPVPAPQQDQQGGGDGGDG